MQILIVSQDAKMEIRFSKEILIEILRVAIEQTQIEWPMQCFEDAQRLKALLDE